MFWRQRGVVGLVGVGCMVSHNGVGHIFKHLCTATTRLRSSPGFDIPHLGLPIRTNRDYHASQQLERRCGANLLE